MTGFGISAENMFQSAPYKGIRRYFMNVFVVPVDPLFQSAPYKGIRRYELDRSRELDKLGFNPLLTKG